MKFGKLIKTCALVTALSMSAFSFTACDFEQVLDEVLSFLEEDVSSSSSSSSSSKKSSSSSSKSSSNSSSAPSSAMPPEEDTPPSTFDVDEIQTIASSDLSIHFLEVGNEYTGDCTLIKVGDTEVLIDAGSRKGSAATIVSYINQFCTDGTLEYVIATHAHQDHIAGFVGTAKAPGVFESFVCETIIDYTLSNSDAAIRDNYEELRDEEVANGAKHYTVLECWNNENGASRSYELADGITMNFLYQRFYEEETSDENDYSVCMLLTEGENHYLFSGDLEHDGEESLVASNDL
ncbi:MAG: MBL fold metallo-hydrolase, partial [Clostridia bacterium]|nr:MBL fold metallo-hydrolase [Clostridia bacterium]